MSTPTALIHIYQEIIDRTKLELSLVKRNIRIISTCRTIVFLCGVAGIIFFWSNGIPSLILVLAFTIIPFVILIKVHAKMFRQKSYLGKKIEVNQDEINAFSYNTSAFDGGSEYIDPTHLYSYDLDIFGEHSLFQYINRTSTVPGKKRLAKWFNSQLLNKSAIVERQQAIKELLPKLKFRQEFRIQGLLYKGLKADEKEIKEWAESPSYYRKSKFLRILPAIVLVVNIVLIGLTAMERCSVTMTGTVFVTFAILSFIFSKKISKIQTLYGKKLQILSTYAALIVLIEKEELKSKALQGVKMMVNRGRKEKASLAVQRLTKLMNALDQRNNVMLALMLNGLFFWELRQMMRIEAWKELYANDLPNWLEAIGNMDAYCSLATFAYNHPSFTFPKPTTHPFTLKAKQMGHPLMQRDRCVMNDIDMNSRPFFIIITGANMAGKSTYLRTVGVNFLLACIGAPVWGTDVTFYPSKLVTSLRTTDSLNENESYFFAELKRLKLIIELLNQDEELFIILDEILKGTNSLDKQKGSLALIKQFMSLKTNGIIATHDLLLGTLIESYPTQIQNYCFEAEIANNELLFAYKMKKGIAQNMNACFLMRKMGIVVMDD